MKGSILEEALALVRGERHETYGDASLEFHRVAAGWRVLANGQPITAEMVPLFMIWLKMVRETVQSKRDNRVDICGYAQLLEDLHTKPPETAPGLHANQALHYFSSILKMG